MGTIDGSGSTEIEAPIETVFAVAADVEGSPRWQRDLKAAECVERDSDGNQVLVRMEADGKIRRITSEIRFSYEPPTRIDLAQEEGVLKSVVGSWQFEDLGKGRTRATYRMEVDPGRVLGLAFRGPVVGMLRNQLINSMPEKLKRFVEADSA